MEPYLEDRCTDLGRIVINGIPNTPHANEAGTSNDRVEEEDRTPSVTKKRKTDNQKKSSTILKDILSQPPEDKNEGLKDLLEARKYLEKLESIRDLIHCFSRMEWIHRHLVLLN